MAEWQSVCSKSLSTRLMFSVSQLAASTGPESQDVELL